MKCLNKTQLIGHVGQDAELRFFTNGNAVCNVSVATSEQWKDKQTGEKKESVEWHRVCIFGKRAEAINEYMVKGQAVFIEGKLKTRSYEKDGATRYSTEIIVDVGGDVILLGGKPAGASQAPQQRQTPARDAASQPAPAQDYDSFDDDIPFS